MQPASWVTTRHEYQYSSQGCERYGLERAWQYGPLTPWFAGPERGSTEHTVVVPTDQLIDLVRSRSSYLTADAAGLPYPAGGLGVGGAGRGAVKPPVT